MSRNLDEVRQLLKEEAEEKAIQEANEPATLLGRFFQEAGDDDDDEGESLEDIEKDMDGMDDDDSDEKDDDNKDGDEEGEEPELGKDDSDVQNEYDEGDVSSLNELIADEQHAMQAYFKAGKETKNGVLARLYNDIGAEEAFHSEQLLYAKAELTGEKYEPSDPEVKKEYEELLANGMDEETAMYTVADKHKLEISIDDDGEDLEDIEKDIENLEESFTMTMAGFDIMMAVQESAAYKTNKALREAYCEYFQCMQETMFMEAMDNVSTKQGSEILGTNNPFIIIGRGIKAVYIFILNLVKGIKNWINKRRIKNKRAFAWLKKHGIKGLFANGVKLYFWNDQTNSFEISDAIAYITMLTNATEMVRSKLGITVGPNYKQNIDKRMPKGNGKVPVMTSLADAKNKIEGVVFSKSKVIVNDQNAGDLENMFFGATDAKDSLTVKNSNGEYEWKSMNIYNALNSILEICADRTKAVDEWLGSVQNAVFKPGSNNKAAKDPDLFKDCVTLLKSVNAGYSKLSKCISADVSTCMKLDQGLLAAVQQGDEGYSKQVNDAAKGENNGNYSSYGDAAYGKPGDKSTLRRADKLQ